MGCGSSTPHGAPAPSSKSSQQIAEALEKKLLQSIIDTKRRKSYKAKKSSVNGLMLQFPKLRAGFKIVREKFKELDKLGTGKVDFDTFKANCNSIGLDESTASIQEVFALADMEGTRQLNQTEFSLVFCIIYLLDTGPKKAIAFPEVKKALDIVEKAFTFFDSSQDGTIERKELALAMKSGTRVFGNKSEKSLADRLFDNLDWDHSGRITFKEFVVGIERMVMDDWDDGGDDDEEAFEHDYDVEPDEEEEGEEEGVGAGQHGGEAVQAFNDWGDDNGAEGAGDSATNMKQQQHRNKPPAAEDMLESITVPAR